MMTFDALSKELCSLKQRMGENVAKFRVHLSQQVQILQTEYPGRIQQEHVEEVKQDHFYKGLRSEYWWMLAHKVDGENPVTHSKFPTTNQIMNVIKESEIDELSVSLNGSRISHLLAGCQMELSLKDNTTARPIPDPTDLNEAVKTTKQEEVEAFIVSDCAWSHKF